MIDWLVTLNSYVWCIVCILYDIMRLELMSLVWLCVWNMVGWLVKYWHEIGMHDKSMIGWW